MKNLKALVVDDSQVNQLVMSKLLESFKIHSICVDSGKEAIRMTTEEEFDLIFMDIQMPEMDGYQTTMKIRTMDKNGGIPIIAVTANVTAEERKKAEQAGMNDYLTKPIHIKDIEKIINKYFYGKKDTGIRDATLAQEHTIQSFFEKLNGDLAFMQDFLKKFEESSKEILLAIETAIKDNQMDQIPEQTHKIKGLLSAVDAENALCITETITQAALTHDQKSLKAGLARLKEEIRDLLLYFHRFVESKEEEGDYE